MTAELQASNAAKALFEGLALTEIEHVYAAIEDPDNGDGTLATEFQTPCVIFWGQNAREHPMGTGNSYVDLHARVYAHANDLTAAEFLALYDEVFSNLYTDSIATDLSAALTDFYCFGVADSVTQTGPRFEGQYRVNEMVLPIYCCPSDIS